MPSDNRTTNPGPRRSVAARAPRLRRSWAWAILLLATLATPGCSWLQNEFFVWDAPPPEPIPELPATEDARGW